MELQELLAEFRNQVADTEQPYLWSDEEVLRYIVDAQDQFVRKIGGISDMSTAAICEVPLVTGEPWADHSPYILRIMSGRLTGAKQDIKFVHEADLKFITEEDYGTNIKYTLDDDKTGTVMYGVLGLEEKRIRWLYVPEEDDTCLLRVYRLPYPRITQWDGQELEIDEQYHMDLLFWMKHRAYMKQDSETRDDKKAADNKVMFMQAAEDARKDHDRRRYRPRVVQYGG